MSNWTPGDYRLHPTRLPYGLALSKPWNNGGFNNAMQVLIQNSASTLYATPTINSSFVVAANSGTITNFTPNNADLTGMVLYVSCITGGCVIIQNSSPAIMFNNIVGTTSAGSTISFTTAGNLTMLNNETLQFIHNGTGWTLVGDRFVLSTQV